ncbi:MAG: nucleoside phosphorylase [Bdellovibrionales bacterium]|nr:nucleoside phosphorylase [Bdellovibrionales bacterium]
MSQKKSHIQLAAGEIPQKFITCGAPERAERIASRLENVRPLAKNREYHSYRGTFRGEEIGIISHGVGSSGAAICWQELIDVGAKLIVRFGTAGGLYSGTQIGDVVVAEGAVRDEGVTERMVHPGFPAVPDPEMTLALRQACGRSSLRWRSGIVLSTDLFYPGVKEPILAECSRSGVAAVEMECSALFVIGRLRAIRTGGLVVLDGNPLEKDLYAPHSDAMKQATEQGIAVVLDAVAGFKLV